MKLACLEKTYQYSSDDKLEYWTESGEIDEDDDGAYTPSITVL